jgi:hypothetical protein
MVWVVCCRIVVHRPAGSNGKRIARRSIASGGGRRGLQVVAAVGDYNNVELGDVGVDRFFEVWHLWRFVPPWLPWVDREVCCSCGGDVGWAG